MMALARDLVTFEAFHLFVSIMRGSYSGAAVLWGVGDDTRGDEESQER
jgi:hypothetical protein